MKTVKRGPGHPEQARGAVVRQNRAGWLPRGQRLSRGQPGAGYSQYLLDECVIAVHFCGLVEMGGAWESGGKACQNTARYCSFITRRWAITQTLTLPQSAKQEHQRPRGQASLRWVCGCLPKRLLTFSAWLQLRLEAWEMAGISIELRANNWTAFSKLDGTCGFGGKTKKKNLKIQGSSQCLVRF